MHTRKINLKYTNIHDNDDATRKYTIGYFLSPQINLQNHFTHYTSNNLKFWIKNFRNLLKFLKIIIEFCNDIECKKILVRIFKKIGKLRIILIRENIRKCKF